MIRILLVKSLSFDEKNTSMPIQTVLLPKNYQFFP